MGPSFAKSLAARALSRSVLLPLLGGLALFLAPACQDPPREAETRDEPWLKETAKDPAEKKRVLSRFRVKDNQSLRVALPTRNTKPEGTLGGITGHVDVDLTNLTASRGELRFALDQLAMAPFRVTTKSKNKRKQELALEANAALGDLTTEALRWLGLGSEVSEVDRAANSTAVFAFTSAREVSHVSAHTATRRKSDGEGEVREATATAVGSLSLRGLSVHRRIPVKIRFHYSDKASPSAVPTSIDVILRGDTRVPLSEYEIAPRDQAGHLITEKAKLLGKFIGTSARLSGQISLNKEGPR